MPSELQHVTSPPRRCVTAHRARNNLDQWQQVDRIERVRDENLPWIARAFLQFAWFETRGRRAYDRVFRGKVD